MLATSVNYDEAAIEVGDLTVCYAEKVAVASLDLRVAAGEVVALLGRNGAGKTTTVETIEGYRKPSAGRVRVLGLDPASRRDQRALTSRMGVMLQKGGVYPGMGAREALQLFAAYYEHPADPESLIEDLDLGGVARTPWRRMSGGEQQRLSLALALVGRPDVAFLDEPTAGVDPHGRLVIREKISSLRDSGAAVIVTTHELAEAEQVADRIVIMDRGRVVASGTPAELLASASGADRIRFKAPAGLDTAALADRISARVCETSPGIYLVSLEGAPEKTRGPAERTLPDEAGRPDASGRPDAAGTPQAVASITTWLSELNVPLGGLSVGASLEDVFLELTERETDRP